MEDTDTSTFFFQCNNFDALLNVKDLRDYLATVKSKPSDGVPAQYYRGSKLDKVLKIQADDSLLEYCHSVVDAIDPEDEESYSRPNSGNEDLMEAMQKGFLGNKAYRINELLLNRIERSLTSDSARKFLTKRLNELSGSPGRIETFKEGILIDHQKAAYNNNPYFEILNPSKN